MWRNTFTLFNLLVVPAAFSLFLLEDYRGALAVGGMAVTNSLIGLTHELRAKWHLNRLSLLGQDRVRVRRDGLERTIAANDVVMDDHLLLASGDTVVADGRLVSANSLEVDEAILTGEADPVSREVGDWVRSGSVCVAGTGTYLAERIGPEAYVQQTTATARKYHHAPGPTQTALNQLVQGLTVVTIALCLGYVALFWVRAFPVTDLVQMIAATITSMVPQGLVLLATLEFVLAAVALGRRGAVIQRLAAVEGLAAVDVICTDKTGTLTTGQQTLENIVAFNKTEIVVRRWLGAFVTASVDQRNKSIETLRRSLAAESPVTEVRDQLPFQSKNRCSAMVLQINGEPRLLVLGSFEALRPRFSDAQARGMDAVWHGLISSGLRVLTFAEGPVFHEKLQGRIPETPLRPLAFITLRDELWPRVTEVLAALTSQGIRLKVVSGDHPETVRTVVKQLGFDISEENMVTGDAWAAADDRVLLADKCHVFGRVSPEQKLALVEALQQAGHNIGMIGDGVNDILAIKRANFGVAMGAGSPAARAVAGVVLESNDFSLLPEVLAEGRRVVQNVRRAAKLFLLKNVYTIVLILVAVGFAGLPFPYLPQQVTLLNALTIGGPAFLILIGRPSVSRPVSPHFFADVWRFLILAGGVTSVVSLMLYFGAIHFFRYDTDTARTLLLAMLILTGVGNAVVITQGDKRLLVWAGFAVGVLMTVMTLPSTLYFFAFEPLGLGQWIVVVTAAFSAIIPTALSGWWGWLEHGNQPPAANDPKPDGLVSSGPP